MGERLSIGSSKLKACIEAHHSELLRRLQYDKQFQPMNGKREKITDSQKQKRSISKTIKPYYCGMAVSQNLKKMQDSSSVKYVIDYLFHEI